MNQKETVKLPTIESLGIFQHESLTLHNETKEEDLVVKDEDFYSFDFKPYVTWLLNLNLLINPELDESEI